jgi:hypothetical protein
MVLAYNMPGVLTPLPLADATSGTTQKAPHSPPATGSSGLRAHGAWVAWSGQPRMYTGVPGVGTSVWKNAAMCIGIRTQPWEAGRRGT